MGILRAETLLRIKKGIKEGIGPTRLYRELRAVGPVTRKTDFLADYRRESGAEEKKGLLRFVRKDRYPSTTIMAGLAPEASKEFLYKIKVNAIIHPGLPIDEQFVNIMSDAPMTPAMIEAEIEERWGEWEKYRPEALEEIQVWSVFRKGID